MAKRSSSTTTALGTAPTTAQQANQAIAMAAAGSLPTTTVAPQPAPQPATTTVTLAQLHSLTRGQLMALGAQHGLKVRDTLPKPVIVDFLAQHLVTGHVPGSVTTSAAGKPAPLASSLPTKARVLAGLAAPPAGRAWHGARATTTTQPAAPPPPAPTASLLAALASGAVGKR